MLDRNELKDRLKKLITNALHDGGARAEQSQIVIEYGGEGRFNVSFADAAYEPGPDSVLLPLPAGDVFRSLSLTAVDQLGEQHLRDTAWFAKNEISPDGAARASFDRQLVEDRLAEFWQIERPAQVASAVDSVAEKAIRALESSQDNYFAFTDYGLVLTKSEFEAQDTHDEAFDMGGGKFYVPSPALKEKVLGMPEDQARQLLSRKATVRESFDRLQAMKLGSIEGQCTAMTQGGAAATWRFHGNEQDITQDVANVLNLPFRSHLGAFFKDAVSAVVAKLSVLLTGDAQQIQLKEPPLEIPPVSRKSKDMGR